MTPLENYSRFYLYISDRYHWESKEPGPKEPSQKSLGQRSLSKKLKKMKMAKGALLAQAPLAIFKNFFYSGSFGWRLLWPRLL